MEVSEEDHIEFDIQNDAVYECQVRFVVKKSPNFYIYILTVLELYKFSNFT